MEYNPREYLLDECYEARARWQRAEWLTTPRVMARVGIDAALDALSEYDREQEQANRDFERVFLPNE